MKIYEDSELIKHKTLAQSIMEQMSVISQKITKTCKKKMEEITLLEKNINECEDLFKISKYSKLLDEKNNDLLKFVSIKNRMEIIKNRNAERFEYLSELLSSSGIYKDKDSKQDLEMLIKEIKNVSEDSININEKHITRKYFNGELFTFYDGKLDLSYQDNYEVLKNANDETLHKIINAYPTCMQTIGMGVLTDVKLKKRILKEISAYIIEQSKTKNFKDINKNLGNILSFKNEIPQDAESFIVGIENALNVKTTVCLAENYKNNLNDIKKLRCNYKSELIPHEIKIAVLSNGLSGDIQSTEEQLSEELKISEQKNIKQNATMEGMKLFEEQNEKFVEEEIEEKQKKKDAIDQKLKEENERQKAEEELSNDEIELLNQILFGLKKDDE